MTRFPQQRPVREANRNSSTQRKAPQHQLRRSQATSANTGGDNATYASVQPYRLRQRSGRSDPWPQSHQRAPSLADSTSSASRAPRMSPSTSADVPLQTHAGSLRQNMEPRLHEGWEQIVTDRGGIVLQFQRAAQTTGKRSSRYQADSPSGSRRAAHAVPVSPQSTEVETISSPSAWDLSSPVPHGTTPTRRGRKRNQEVAEIANMDDQDTDRYYDSRESDHRDKQHQVAYEGGVRMHHRRRLLVQTANPLPARSDALRQAPTSTPHGPSGEGDDNAQDSLRLRE